MTVQVYDGDGDRPVGMGDVHTPGIEDAVNAVLAIDGVEKELRLHEWDDLVRLHHDLGCFLRNKLKLWEMPEPLFTDARRFFTDEQLATEGYTMHGKVHPDCVSQLIIEQAWKKLYS